MTSQQPAAFQPTMTSPRQQHIQPPSPAFSTPPTLHGFDKQPSIVSPEQSVDTRYSENNEEEDLASGFTNRLDLGQIQKTGAGGIGEDLTGVDEMTSPEGEEEQEEEDIQQMRLVSAQVEKGKGRKVLDLAGVGPRMTKAALLRQGLPTSASLPSTSTRTREAVDYGNTPGHKRGEMKIVVASTSAPTIIPRQTKASLLRTTNKDVSTKLKPTLQAPSTTTLKPSSSLSIAHSPMRANQPSSIEGSQASATSSTFGFDTAAVDAIVNEETSVASPARPRVTRPQSLYAPSITPRVNKAAMLRMGGLGGAAAGSASPVGEGSGNGNGQEGDQENKKGSPGRADGGDISGLSRSRSMAEKPKSLDKPIVTPRGNRSSMLRANPTSNNSPSPNTTITTPRSTNPASHRPTHATTPSTSSSIPKSPLPNAGSGGSSTHKEAPRSTLERYRVLTKDEQKSRDEELFRNTPGHHNKKRQSMGPGVVASLAEPRMTPKSNRSAALRRDPTLQYLPPPPPAFKARPLPAYLSGSAFPTRPSSSMSMRRNDASTTGRRKGSGDSEVF